jgi:hypothetical protein
MIAGKVYSQEQTLGGLSLGFGVSGLVITAIFCFFSSYSHYHGNYCYRGYYHWIDSDYQEKEIQPK